ncbi:ABC transporter permease, partial [Acinetobacter baumannii]
VSNNVNLSYEDNILNGVGLYGITNEFNSIQTIEIAEGRYLNESDFVRGVPVGVIGYKVAEELFGNAEKAVNKEVSYSGRKLYVV